MSAVRRDNRSATSKAAAAAAAVLWAVAACSSNGSMSTSTSIAAPSIGTATSTPASRDCAPESGNRVRIYSGDITCADAYAIAGRYDFKLGPKYQQIKSVDTWTCQTSTADLRPMILSCISDQKAEFDVSTVS